MTDSNIAGNPAPTEYDCHTASEHGACPICANGERLGFRFSYAYQPIIDLNAREIFAHEALIRGPQGEPAPSVLSHVTEDNRFRFDQACRVRAIKTAAKLNMRSKLSINFLPNSIYRPETCIRSTLEAARAHNFPVDQIIFETVEGERVKDAKWLTEVFIEYQRIGFLTAIDDFGAGFAGLNLLADFHPDIIKLDMDLIRRIDQSRTRQAIVRAVVAMSQELGITAIGEGVETLDECSALYDLGIHLMQGYLFSMPLFESCSQADSLTWPAGLPG